MGTRGWIVHRHKGRYYVYYNHRDSYPDGLGLEVLGEIPRNVSKEEFEKWAWKTRDMCSQRKVQLLNDPDADDKTSASDEQPQNNIFIEWIYEIDLDNLVFHVNAQPLFRLDNMPPDKIFLKSISFDHFGHRALSEHTPTQFRYDWRAPPPSPPTESLVAYNRFNNRSSTSSVPDLLGIPVTLSSADCVRTAFVELLVTRWMTETSVGHDVRLLENVPDRDHIPRSMLQLALSILNLAVGVPIPSMPCTPHGNPYDFVWFRKDVCLRITTHLDDENVLKATIGDLVNHIDTTPDKVGTVYGIACSIFHCVIVRVDKDGLGTSIAHTPALQFLPSFYARTMFTPGIEALSRLGSQASGVEFLNSISDVHCLPRITHKELLVVGSAVEKLPVEVWARIGGFITLPKDLVTLAAISPRAMSAAADLTRFPLVEGFRLVDVVASGPFQPIPEPRDFNSESESEDEGEDEDEDILPYFYELGRAKFTAVRDGRRINVELGQEFHKGSAGRREISFKIQSYLSGPANPDVLTNVLANDELYVLELDDDRAI